MLGRFLPHKVFYLLLLIPFVLVSSGGAEACSEPFSEESENETNRPMFRSADLWKLQTRIRDRKASLDGVRSELQRLEGLRNLGELNRGRVDLKANELRARRDLLGNELRGLYQNLNNRYEQERPALEAQWHQAASLDGQKQNLADYLNLFRVLSLNPGRLVSFIVSDVDLVHSETNTVSDVIRMREILVELAKRGYTPVVNIDGSGTKLLLEGYDGPYLGISAHQDKTRNDAKRPVVALGNDYARLIAMGHATDVIVSQHSPYGFGLLLKNKATMVIDSANRWRNPLVRWQFDLEEARAQNGLGDFKSMGLRFQRIPAVRNFEDVLAVSPHLRFQVPKPTTTRKDRRKLVRRTDIQWLEADVRHTWRADRRLHHMYELGLADLGFSALEDGLEYNHRITTGQKQLAPYNKIAAVYGSGSTREWYNRQIQWAAAKLSREGYAVVTGGAQGVMALANEAASEVGGASIGIPILAKSKIANETDIPFDLHTETIRTHDYTSRIPLLSLPASMIVFAPGGKGTMNELAAVLSMGERTSLPRLAVWEVEPYYTEGLLKTMRSLGFRHPIEVILATESGIGE